MSHFFYSLFDYHVAFTSLIVTIMKRLELSPERRQEANLHCERSKFFALCPTMEIMTNFNKCRSLSITHYSLYFPVQRVQFVLLEMTPAVALGFLELV